VVHPNGSTRLLADTSLKTFDLSVPGTIKGRLADLKAKPPSPDELAQLAEITALRFGEKKMAEQFMLMMDKLRARQPQLVRMR
jgi:hypothetical protein